MSKHVALLGSFDTKWRELEFLKAHIARRGCKPLCIDVSIGGNAPGGDVDITSAEVAVAANADIQQIRAATETHVAMQLMIDGASKTVRRLYEAGRLDGIISIGGASNTALATAVMGALPFGIPKVMISSVAAVPEYAASYFGTTDLVMIHSVVDIARMNPLLENVLERGAAAVCAMVESGTAVGLTEEPRTRPRVALTEFKFSEKCCQWAAEYLEAAGMEVLAIHAQGIGDRALAQFVDKNAIDGVLDIVPAGVSEELFGGNRAAGPARLEEAGKHGIAQVIAPSGFDMISCGPIERRDRGDVLWSTRKLRDRKLFIPDALRAQARTSAAELEQVADVVAAKLNRAQGSVSVLIPTLGWSSLSETGRALFDPEADAAFVRRLERQLAPHIPMQQLDLTLNSPEFARLAVDELLRLMKSASGN